jgi:hypothetical protein
VVLKRVSQGSFLQRTVLKHDALFTEGRKGEEADILTEGQMELSGSMDGRKKVFAVLRHHPEGSAHATVPMGIVRVLNLSGSTKNLKPRMAGRFQRDLARHVIRASQRGLSLL